MGGARPGAGRKPKADEQKVTLMAQAAIVKKYGSMEEGLQKLLDSAEPVLMRFVWEHAIGKPRDKVDFEGDMEIVVKYEKRNNNP